jgi:hypothetical protein
LLPDFDAETKFPYGSKACLVPVALGHNLIHRICEEVDKRLGELGCIKRWHAYVFLKKSSTWHAVQRLAHIVFHNLCAHLGVPGRIMIKNIAGLICPLNSKALVLIKALANNLFHKICEEAPPGDKVMLARPDRRSHVLSGMGLYQSWRVQYLIRKPVVSRMSAQILGSPLFLFSIQALARRTLALLTSFSTVCVQSCPDQWTTRAA